MRRGENKFENGRIQKVKEKEQEMVATMDSHAPQATMAGLLRNQLVFGCVCQGAPGVDPGPTIRRPQCMHAPKSP
jgi:hypothetical protein